MQDTLTRLALLKRPPLLVRSARYGAQVYRRTPHLYRLLGYCAGIRHGEAVLRLMDIEEDLNRKRLAADAGYSVSRHVEVLSALVGEAQHMHDSIAGEVA
ncbi:DUF6477 family protein [Pseudoprimorskyibacter insulae]|uniref:Uncharacterized protein n=1 Tax=Pseudoprimorskyibacter insulae TaxID=1695997 RepID=A0A2R8AWL1_9RHOB|nr:DUF6477 family protein [Pseudoprimorskyibacter insulae]SPF80431.1 hypothetical protein PRI8871_02237 [Pseudoprimorskyibacter insulae]